MQAVIHVFNTAADMGNAHAVDLLVKACPWLARLRPRHRLSYTLRPTRKVRSHVSYRYKRKRNQDLAVPTKPVIHYTECDDEGCQPFWSMINTSSSFFVFPTSAIDVILREQFLLRGFTWKRQSNVWMNDGRVMAIWERDAGGTAVPLPAHVYDSLPSGDCGCETHHVVHGVGCPTCVPDADELPVTLDKIATQLGCDVDMVCSARRMTRCHHVGAHVLGIRYLYYRMQERVTHWPRIKDRLTATPSLSQAHCVTHPEVLPCIRSVRTVVDIPYYRRRPMRQGMLPAIPDSLLTKEMDLTKTSFPSQRPSKEESA